MPSKTLTSPDEGVDDLIREIRDQKVILALPRRSLGEGWDSDLARIYGVSTKRLNEQLRRNRNRFPKDFAFQLTVEDAAGLRSQHATSSSQSGRRYRPWAFTQFGALKMSLYVIRAFVKSRDDLVANSAIVKRLAQIDNTLFLHDSALRDPWRAVASAKAALPKAASTSPLAEPPQKPRIGFHPENIKRI